MDFSKKKYFPTAFVLYLTYFIHGIGCSMLGQQVMKESLVAQWGNGADIGLVTTVAAALGLGRLITLPFAGPISDKFGRKVCSIIGVVTYAMFFIGIAISPNMWFAYVAAILGGVANSFLDCGVIPACVEIMPTSGLATMSTKLFISVSQLLLPWFIGLAVGSVLGINGLMYVAGAAIIVIGVLIFFMPTPAQEAKAAGGKKESLIANIKNAHFTVESIALILIGFTCTATFQLWLNCAQTFGKEIAGMSDTAVSGMQSLYATGTIIAILITAVLTSKIKSVRFLFIYPLVSLITLVLVFTTKSPAMCKAGAFLLGFFAAGGVLQLATATVNDLFPGIKGTITSIIMIASSLSNYTILSAAGKMSPQNVMVMNIVITVIGVALALFVNVRYGKLLAQAEKE